MSALRLSMLCFGPLGLVWASYAASGVDLRSADAVGTARPALTPELNERLEPVPDPIAESNSAQLVLDCHAAAETLRRRLGADVACCVRPPFVVAGDFTAEELQRLVEHVIEPVCEALHASYFERRPDRPISIAVLSNEQRFGRAARDLDHRQSASHYGYFVRTERRIVLNVSTGHGTLAHELTHALATFDAPRLPLWFEEGLAALHEQCEFSADGSRLIGQSNWRGAELRSRPVGQPLPTVEQFISGNRMPDEDSSFEYAYARYFCLYLQSKGVLTKAYRLLRDGSPADDRGLSSVAALIHPATLQDLDKNFGSWLNSELQ